MSYGEGLPQILTPLPMMMKVVATGLSLGLPPMSLFHMTRTVITDEGVKTHLAKVWAMML